MILSTSIVADCTQAKEREDRGDFEGAWALLSPHIERINELEPKSQAHVLLGAGTIAARTGYVERETSKDWLSRSLELFDRLGDSLSAGGAAFGLALHCKISGAFSEAYIWLDLAREKTDGGGELTCRIELLRGIVKEDEGKWREALEIYCSIAPLFESLTNHTLRAKYHGELAVARRQLATGDADPGMYDLALVENAAASYHYEQAGDFRASAIIKNNIAYLRFKLGRLDEALEDINDGIAICAKLKDRATLAQFKETKAQILSALGRDEEAEVEARESCDLLRIGGERALLLESLITHGRCLARLGSKVKAFYKFQVAQDVAEFIEFNHGLGLVSLTILEEFPDLDLDTRRLHHKVILEKLNLENDKELIDRHNACIRITAESFKADMGLKEPEGSLFSAGFSLDATVLAFERLWIECALEEASGCQKEAARLLGISPSNLNFKLNNQHKAAKRLQTYGHYRGVKPQSHIDTKPMPNDALTELGINEGDSLVLKAGCRVKRGDVVMVRSRRKLYVGIYEQVRGTTLLSPANPDYETLHFNEGNFEIVSKVVGFIPKNEVGRPDAQVRQLSNVSSAARLPAS